MDTGLFRLKWVLLPAAVVLVAAAPVMAQPSDTNSPSQSMIVSALDNDQVSSNVTETTQSPSRIQNMLQMFQDQSPVANMGNLPVAPAPMPVHIRQHPKSSEDNQQWEFMTPAEILGVTPGQILHTQTRKKDENPFSLTPVQRLLLGQSPVSQFQTSAGARQNPWPSGTSDNSTNGVIANLISASLGSLDASGDANSGDNPFSSTGGKTEWSSLFGPSLPSPSSSSFSSSLQQQEDMKQFLRILNPHSALAGTASAPPDDTSSQQAATTNAFSGFNSIATVSSPFANPFASQQNQNGIGKPADATLALPSVTARPSMQGVASPAWRPQPPPWLSATPQPFAVPRRKF